MNVKYERQMKKGVLDMLVLKLLETEPKYGYQIIQEMKEKSEAEGKQVPRKYYVITENGREALSQMEAIWKRISSGILNIMED